MSRLKQIIDLFYQVTALDPQLIILRQSLMLKTPLVQQQCNIQKRRVSKRGYKQFVRYYEAEFRRRNIERSIPSSYFKEGTDRHWGFYKNVTNA